jgi:hypothetical protein
MRTWLPPLAVALVLAGCSAFNPNVGPPAHPPDAGGSPCAPPPQSSGGYGGYGEGDGADDDGGDDDDGDYDAGACGDAS